MTLPTRKFGVEVEFVGITRIAAARVLRAAGIEVATEDYNHHTRAHWKLVTDGSVVDEIDRTRGGELVSPPLSGHSGLEQVRTALRAMAEAGATVNKSCGLHVHTDASDLSGMDVARIFTEYRSAEGLINQFMPRSRVNNNYCPGLAQFSNYDFSTLLTRLQTPEGRNSWGEAIGGLRRAAENFNRYRTVNIASYARHGTVEFRHHSGSVNATKVTNWIQFLLYFVANCKAMNVPATVSAPVASASVAAPARRRRGRQTNYAARRALWTLLASLNVNSPSGMSAAPIPLSRLAEASGYTVATVNVLLSGLRSTRTAGGRIMNIRTRASHYDRGGIYRSGRCVVSVSVMNPTALNTWLGYGESPAIAPVAAPVAPVAAPVVRAVSVTDVRETMTPADLFRGMPAEIGSFYRERASDFGYDWV